MKKRVFSLFLAAVMLLSVFSLAIVADGEDTTGDTTENTYPTYTMDGVMGEDEGWDGVRVYEFDQHVYDGTGKDAIHRDERVESITGESNIRFSYDAENIYIYYETSNYDTLNHENGTGGLLLRIAPEVGVDMRGHGYTDGTYFYIWLNLTNDLEFEGKQPTNEDVVGSIWDLIFTDDNHSAWGLGVKTLINQFGFQGWYDDYGDYSTPFAKNSLIALHVEKDENDVGIKKSVEMKLPMPALYKERIAANEENGTNDPVFYFVAYERSRTYNGTYEPMVRDEATGDVADTGTSNAGYFVSLDEETPIVWGFEDPGYKENSRMEYGAPVTLTEYTPEVHTNFGKTVTVNGHMDEGEGWSYSPLFQTTLNTNGSKTDILNNSQPDTNPTTIRVSCDGQKVYFFIETTHEDTLKAAWQDVNPDPAVNDWQTACFYLHFYPNSDTPRSTYGADNGRWFTLALNTFSTLALKDANFDANGDFIWDMNNASAQTQGDTGGNLFFWRLQWGPEAANQYSKDYCLAGVELAAHIDKNDEGQRTKLCVEFAFPLAQEVVAELEDGDLDYKIAFFERNNVYKDMSAENPEYVISKDGGYLIEDVYVDSRLKTDEADFGIPVVLKQNTEGVYADFVEWFEDYKANAEYENLKNLVVNFLGDDYFLGGKIADYYKWTTMIDEIYNWNITNYVEEGIMTSTYDDLQLFPLSRLYRSMSSNTPNVVLVSGGLNDYLNGAPIGTINDTKTDTYMGALKTLIDGLRDKYRDACIVFTTMYNVEGSVEGSTLTSADYAAALKEVCEYKKVYCLDLFDAETYGIDMSSADFRAEYCQSADDTVNLNLEGNKLLLATYEKFVSESLTDWAANKDAMLAAWEATKTTGGNNGGNSGNTDNNGGNTDNNTDNKPTETTPAPAPTEPEKKGCGGVIGVGSALAVLAIVSCAGAVCFKKHD